MGYNVIKRKYSSKVFSKFVQCQVLTGAESEISAEEMECEMQAREFFVHIGMLILEGRTPQCSEKGRVEGPHCLSFFNVVPHVCDQKGNYSVSQSL